jgi:hypothetical protein
MRKYTIVDKATGEETGADTDMVERITGVDISYIDWVLQQDRKFENVDWVVKADYGSAALQQILAQIDSGSHGASRPHEEEGNEPEQEDQGDRQPT